MNSMMARVAWCSLLACPVISFAQTGGSQADGNANFFRGNAPTFETSTGPTVDFRPEGGATTDHMFGGWWYYRVSGDTRERPFGIYTNSAGGALAGSSTYAGNTATYNWTETDSAAVVRFNAVYTSVLTDGLTPGSATLTNTFSITNPGSVPLVITLFNYADFDVNASAGGDSATGNINSMTITEGSTSIVFSASNASAFQVAAFAAVRDLLLNANVDNLNNTGLPFGPGDFTGAYQWNLTVQPGGTLNVESAWAITVAVPEPATLACVGAGVVTAGFGYRRWRAKQKRRVVRSRS